MVIFGVQNGFLFLLRWTEPGHDQLLQQGHVEFGSGEA